MIIEASAIDLPSRRDLKFGTLPLKIVGSGQILFKAPLESPKEKSTRLPDESMDRALILTA
jgi:hypothetical protein